MQPVLDPHDDQRIRALEENTARLDERVKGVAGQVRDLAAMVNPLASHMATMAAQLEQMNSAVDELAAGVKQRDATATADRKVAKSTLWTVVGSLGATAITAVGGIVVVMLK